MRNQVASYKKPKSVVFVETIPRRGFVPDYDLLDGQHGGADTPAVNRLRKPQQLLAR